MDKYTIAPPAGSTNNSVGAEDRPWHEGHFDSVKLNGGDLGEYLAESTGYGIVSGCTPSISGLTVTVAAGIVHLADGTRKELSATNITLDSADSINPRIDLVYINSTGTVAKITGTASASPVAPTLPTGGISVATVSVAAGATTGTVTDIRLIANTSFFTTDYKTVRYMSEVTNKVSRVHYVIIQSGHKPKLKLAKDAINNVDNFCNMTCESKATVAINAGVFNTSTNETHGAIVVNSELLRTNEYYNTEDSEGHYILYSKNGVLNAVKAKDTSDSALMSLNPEWAVQGWYPVVLGGVLLQEHTATNDLHPRSFIGQDVDGNYIVGTFDGRSFKSAGATMKDMYDFCLSVNFTPYFLYNLDGGGSCHFSLCGVKVNDYIEHSYRKVANMIYFDADNTIEDSVYEEVKNSELERALENTQYGDCAVIPQQVEVAGIASENATTVGFSMYKKTADTENGGYKYPRVLKLARDLPTGVVSISALINNGIQNVLRIFDTGEIALRYSNPLDFKETTIKPWGDLLLTNDDYTISYDGKENYKYIAIFEVADCLITKTFYGYNLDKFFWGERYAIDVINPTNGNINCITITSSSTNILVKKTYGSDRVYLKRLVSFGCP